MAFCRTRLFPHGGTYIVDIYRHIFLVERPGFVFNLDRHSAKMSTAFSSVSGGFENDILRLRLPESPTTRLPEAVNYRSRPAITTYRQANKKPPISKFRCGDAECVTPTSFFPATVAVATALSWWITQNIGQHEKGT